MIESWRYENVWTPYFKQAALAKSPAEVFNARIKRDILTGDPDIGRDMLAVAEHLFEDIAIPPDVVSFTDRRLNSRKQEIKIPYWQQMINYSTQAEYPDENSPHHGWGEAIEIALRVSAIILTRPEIPQRQDGRVLFKKLMGVEPEEFLQPGA